MPQRGFTALARASAAGVGLALALSVTPTYQGAGVLNWQIICTYDAVETGGESSENGDGSYVSRLETLYPPASTVSNVMCKYARLAGGEPLDPNCP